MTNRNTDYYIGLVRELLKLPKESEWVEFKHNNSNKEEIGSYLTALSNAAALLGKPTAYVVWGIQNETHEVLGTTFDPFAEKVGNEELENWLLQRLNPKLHFQFHSIQFKEKPVVVLEIPAASRHPTSFQNEELIRVGSYRKKLKDLQEKERELWRTLDKIPFESLIAMERVDGDKVLQLLDYVSLFDLLEQSVPDGNQAILDYLATEELITKHEAGGFNITNLGAVLFAKKITDFSKLSRKTMRVIRYKGTSRIETLKEQPGTKGYAAGFEGLVDYIMGQLPSNEVIEKALRKSVPMYPELAVRELIANAVIHQDFFERGTGPMIEIFDDRLEVTNPGVPLIDTQRFLDSPPTSRNETLASLMRRFGICEERGSGIDKVVFQTEYFQLPAPLFETPNGFTKVILFAHKDFDDMSKADRIRACYLHACLQFVNRKKMINKSLRERFGLDEDKVSVVTRVINGAVKAGVITKSSSSESRRDTSYVPYWSVSND
ncbi:MAG: ATP-binding protein [Pontiella sp.]